MPDEFVIVATYATPEEAELAKNHLEAEGVPVQLADDATVGWFWHLGNAVGGVKLLVAPDRLEQCNAILQSIRPIETSDAPAEIDAEHQCQACGAAMDPDMDFCPSCEAANERRSHREARLLVAADSSANATDEFPDSSPGDDMALRALRAAVFGLIGCPPLLHLYSLYWLLRLALHSGEVSPKGLRHGLLALFIDVGVIVIAVVFVSPWLAYRYLQ